MDVDVSDTLRKIVAVDANNVDHENLTAPLLYEDPPYDRAIGALSEMAAFLDGVV